MCSRKWLIVALVACGLASACQDYNTNLSIQTAASVLTYVSPSSATMGSSGFTITANGSGFTTGAFILWNTTPLNTTLVSSIQLTAPVPASLLATPGTVQIAVQIPGSAQSPTQNIYATTTTEISNVVLFTVGQVPGTPPSIASLSPTSAPFCGNPTSFSLLVNASSGTTFTSDSVVNWNGSPRKPPLNNQSTPTQLQAAILPADTASTAAAVVTVSNSSGTSNGLPFTITSPTANLAAPQPISSLMPASALAGSAAVTLTVMGGNILPCSVVQWVSASNGTTTLPTQYVSPTQVTATIPASNLLAAGTAQVVVVTPGPGGGTTLTNPAPAAATFTITQPPAPTITSLSATLFGATSTSPTAPSCSPSTVTLNVFGTDFATGSVVNWNGTPRPTTYVASSPLSTTPYLTAIIPFADAISAGSFPVTVSNGSAVSNAVNFSIVAPSTNFQPPTGTSPLNPSTATAGSGQFTLNVTGINFVPCSVVQWNGSPRATTYLSPTLLSATILASDLSTAGSVPVTIFTPAPGGGTSTALPFTVAPLAIASLSASTGSTPPNSTPYCSPAGFTLTVAAATGTTFTSDTVVNWNGSPRPTTFVSGSQLNAAITYADIAALGTVNVSVSNSAMTSNSLPFSMTAPSSFPVPSIGSLMPSSAAAGSGALVLSVIGNGLLPCSTVQWNGSPRTTTFVGTTGLTASIAAADVAAVANIPVTVANPVPTGCTPGTGITCGGTSNSSTFTVFTPVPAAGQKAATAQATAGAVSSDALGLLTLPLLSSDHRYAVHLLASTDGVSEIAGSTQNVFVRDTCLGAPSGCTPSETLVSIGVSTNPADGGSLSPAISANGRYVAFLSSASNLVDSDTNGVTDVFVRDTCAGVASGCTPSTQRVSVATDGTQANGPSTSATIDASGRFVTFQSAATNLGSTSTGFFLRDTCAGVVSGCTPSTEALP